MSTVYKTIPPYCERSVTFQSPVELWVCSDAKAGVRHQVAGQFLEARRDVYSKGL